jgi:hypothetical protein
MVDAVARFAGLAGEPDPALDEAMFAISSALLAVSPAAAPRARDELDRLAADAGGTFDTLRVSLFERAGFCGALGDYRAARSVLLEPVLQRRRGIPIALAIVMIEVGRRAGIRVEPIGMPGHFLVRDPESHAYCDPFAGGVLLDEAGAAARFRSMYGDSPRFHPSMLTPIRGAAVLSRVLSNLEQSPIGRDLVHRMTLLRLHASVPGLAARERLALASELVVRGDHRLAAQQAEFAASLCAPAQAREALAFAAAYRAHDN